MVYIRLHSELIDVYLHLSLPRFQFTKKIKNWNSEKVYLVICRCLLIVCGSLWWLAVVCWWFVIVCARLGWFVLVCVRCLFCK